MAEKLAWGYEEVEPDPTEALRLFRQAADLGFSDAIIRMGEFQEQGKGTPRDPKAAFLTYARAARCGNFLAFAFMAKLLVRGSRAAEAEKLWDRFIAELQAKPKHGFQAAANGELLHAYIIANLQLGLEPRHVEVLLRYRVEIAGHHQRLLEYSRVIDLDRLEAAMEWIKARLGPWPIPPLSGPERT